MTDPISQSCDPRGLYGGGGFPGLPAEFEPLLALGPGAERVCELYPAFAYTRPARPGFVADNPGFRAHVAHMQDHANVHRGEGAPCGLYRIEDAILRDSVVYLPREDGTRVLYETYRPQDRATVGLATREQLAAARPAPEGLAVFIGSSGSFNYGHWLVDDLPRLRAVHALRRRSPEAPVTVLITAQDPIIDYIRLQSIELALADAGPYRVEILRRDEALRLPTLHLATPVTVHPALKSPDALRWIARRLRHRTIPDRLKMAASRTVDALGAGRLPQLRRRLFVERSPVRSRPLRNADAVFARLAALGFERLDGDAMPFKRQVATFADAQIVVGSAGAAMTNTLFCRPGTPVVYLGPEGWVETFFWDLATVMGHRYHALYGPSEAGGDPFVSPYAVDVDRLSRMLGRLLR